MWRYSETPGLLALLTKALVRTLWDAGCRSCGRDASRDAVIAAQQQMGAAGALGENTFLEHDITSYRRFAHVFRDLEYALQARRCLVFFTIRYDTNTIRYDLDH